MSWARLCVLCVVMVGVLASPRRLGKRSAEYTSRLQGMGRFDPMHDECGLEEDERQECGKRTYEGGECKRRGCCYRPCEGCEKEIPWCFLAKRMLREECAVSYEDKDDCGHYGISEGECFMRDCCWKPSGLPNDPPCFKKKSSGHEEVTIDNGPTDYGDNYDYIDYYPYAYDNYYDDYYDDYYDYGIKGKGKGKGDGRNGFKGKPSKRQVKTKHLRSPKVQALLRNLKARQVKRSRD